MDDYGWGLTSAGFRRPTYVELLDALEYKARELFGATANLSVRSPLGMFLRIFAWMLNILFSVLEDVYNRTAALWIPRSARACLIWVVRLACAF